MAKGLAKRGRPAGVAKLAIWCRIDKAAIAALDEIAQGSDPKPSRAALIDLAVRQFVDRDRKK